MEYKMTDKRFDSIKRFFDEVWKEPEKFPSKSIVLSLDDNEISRIFTKKRLSLIKTLQSRKISSLSELADLTNRKLSAIERDLKILESLGIIELEKKGRIVKPSIKRELIVVPLIDFPIKNINDIEKREEKIVA